MSIKLCARSYLISHNSGRREAKPLKLGCSQQWGYLLYLPNGKTDKQSEHICGNGGLNSSAQVAA